MDPDINYIIRESLNGDKNYQEILLNKLIPLIYKNIYKYWDTKDPITEDLVQEGFVLILESLKTFDKSRYVHFLYYIKIKLLYFYKNYYRNTQKERADISLTKSIGQENINLEKIFKSNHNTLDSLISKEEINELLININKLTPIEQKTLYLYYYEQLTMYEISDNLNIPYRTAIGKKQAAIKKLKKFMISRR